MFASLSAEPCKSWRDGCVGPSNEERRRGWDGLWGSSAATLLDDSMRKGQAEVQVNPHAFHRLQKGFCEFLAADRVVAF